MRTHSAASRKQLTPGRADGGWTPCRADLGSVLGERGGLAKHGFARKDAKLAKERPRSGRSRVGCAAESFHGRCRFIGRHLASWFERHQNPARMGASGPARESASRHDTENRRGARGLSGLAVQIRGGANCSRRSFSEFDIFAAFERRDSSRRSGLGMAFWVSAESRNAAGNGRNQWQLR